MPGLFLGVFVTQLTLAPAANCPCGIVIEIACLRQVVPDTRCLVYAFDFFEASSSRFLVYFSKWSMVSKQRGIAYRHSSRPKTCGFSWIDFNDL